MHEKIVLQQFLHFGNYMFDNLMCVGLFPSTLRLLLTE